MSSNIALSISSMKYANIDGFVNHHYLNFLSTICKFICPWKLKIANDVTVVYIKVCQYVKDLQI